MTNSISTIVTTTSISNDGPKILSELSNVQDNYEKGNANDDNLVTTLADTKSTRNCTMRQRRQQQQTMTTNDDTVSFNNNNCNTSTVEAKSEQYTTREMKNTTTTMSSYIINLILKVVLSIFVWTGMILVPLLLSSPYSPTSYQLLFPSEWYEYENYSINASNSSIGTRTSELNYTTSITAVIQQQQQQQRPKPLGLCLGIVAVAIGQICTWIFVFILTRYTNPISVQSQGPVQYNFFDGLLVHICQPEGFGLLVSYLSITWLCSLLPNSYYNFNGTIQYDYLLACLLVQDCIQYCMHRLEHSISPEFYKKSHKPHHKFTNPKVFDAFNGSIADTICMILIPLYSTAVLLPHVNVWTYMAFGSIYANWLTLIHSEYILPWDELIFTPILFGTPADHHVHHKFFKFNYGHLFMYWDILFGTYRSPQSFGPKAFNNTHTHTHTNVTKTTTTTTKERMTNN